MQFKVLNIYFASHKQHLSEAREELEIIQDQQKDQVLDANLCDEEKKLLQDIEKWSTVEEILLRQKSSVMD